MGGAGGIPITHNTFDFFPTIKRNFINICFGVVIPDKRAHKSELTKCF